MNVFDNLLLGFAHILNPEIVLFSALGCALGMLTGILPGFGPSAATALLLPLAFVLDPTASIVMIAAIYYGSMYGGTITSVLLNVPGEVSSIATGIDGYQMTLRGQAGKALAIAAVGSFVGGMLAVVGMLFASQFASLALGLTFLDVFALSLLALSLVIGLTGRSIVKGLISAVLGLLVGTVGLDQISGTPRFTFGSTDLSGGISFIAIVMGLFGLAEILKNLGQKQPVDFSSNIGPVRLTLADLKATAGSMGRGTVIGFFFGLVPGSPAAASAFTSYAVEKKVSKSPERFGKGAIQGVAGPETANNALGISNFIPLLTLGIPSSATMAILLGAFTINGLQPGPLLFTQHPEIAWGLIASLVLANVILLIMALPLVRVWVSILRIPTRILYPATIGVMCVGAYTINNSIFEVWVMWIAGLVGLVLQKFDVPLTPAALTLVLGPMLEANFRRGLSLSDDAVATFFGSPTSMFAFVLIAVVFVTAASKGMQKSARKSANRLLISK
jgi:putative tricarboxylic transport membrane protein